MNSSQRQTSQCPLPCLWEAQTWSESPGIMTFPGISHCCALPFKFLLLQALSLEKIRQWRVQRGSHKFWRTRVVPGTLQCSGSRRAVPSPGKPPHTELCSGGSSGAPGGLVLPLWPQSFSSHHSESPHQSSLSLAGRKMLLSPMSEAPCGRTSLHGSFPVWMLNTNL